MDFLSLFRIFVLFASAGLFLFLSFKLSRTHRLKGIPFILVSFGIVFANIFVGGLFQSGLLSKSGMQAWVPFSRAISSPPGQAVFLLLLLIGLFRLIRSLTPHLSEHYSSLVEHSLVGVYLLQDERFVFVNPRFAEIFEYSRQELTGKPFLDLVAKESLDRVAKAIHLQPAAGGESFGIQAEFLTRSGRRISAEMYGSRMMHLGKPAFHGTLQDITQREILTETLSQNREYLNKIITGTPITVWALDRNGVFMLAEGKGLAVLGVEADELIGRSLFEFAGETGGIRENFQRALAGEILFSIDRPRGRILESRYSPLRDKNGLVYGVTGVSMDITDRMNAESALRDSEQKYRTLIEHMNEGVLQVDHNDIIQFANERYCELVGYTKEELRGMCASDLIAREEDRALVRGKNLLRMEGVADKYEIQLKKKSGEVMWVQISGSPLLDDAKRVIGSIGIHTDITERKIAEEALRASEERFRRIFEGSQIGIVLVAPDLSIIDANQAMCRMMGYSHEELLVTPIAKLTHPDDLAMDYEQAMKLRTGEKQSYTLQKRYLRKSGEVIWGNLSASFVRDEHGTVLYGVAMVEDITVPRRVQESLILLESAVRQAQESIVITKISAEGDEPEIVFVNPAFERMTGFSSEEAVRRSLHLLNGPNTDPAAAGKRDHAIMAGELFHGELVNYRKDGTECTLEWHIAPIKDAGGRVSHSLAMQRDISSRKIHEEALRKSEKRYRLFFEEDLTGDYIATPDGTILECNSAFARMFGFASVEEARRHNISSLFKESDHYSRFLALLREQRKLDYHEIELCRRDGTPVDIIENVIGIFNHAGEFLKFKGYLFDNTERKKLEHQLRHVQKMESIGTLAAGMAHNFNNIMSIILGYTSILKQKPVSPEKLATSVDAIGKAVYRGSNLVRQLTTFARKTDLHFEHVNVNETISELLPMLQETFPRTIQFVTELDRHIPLVLADPNQLHQVLLNLLLNARDAMPEGGTLMLTSGACPHRSIVERFPDVRPGHYVRITIEDTGIGLDEGMAERIFEPFFTTKEVGTGTGLGLAVVYGIVEHHGGFIDVQSRKGDGTTFDLYLPAYEGQAPQRNIRVEEPARDARGTETILLVEDDEILIRLVKNLLEENGYRAIVARDGEEALQLYFQHKDQIALVLTDVGLPLMGGGELLKRVQEINKDARVVVASGYMDSEVKNSLLRQGARDFIQKPYEPEDILQRVRRVLDSA